ncbi:MAG: branched-chain amino acid ABC transporter permease [Clostridiales bacterium]|jgi:branched-chain amino acid transport system permease protein|nr:branched-chain amino acid ABC transporter permease [Clostridiales bacterium]
MSIFLNAILGQFLVIAVTVLATFAVTLIFKTSTTTNFAQGSIAALGCYVVADLLNKYKVPVYYGVLVGMVVGIGVGLVVDLVIFRKGRNVNAIGKQIITMGLVSVIFGGIPVIFGSPENIPFAPFYNYMELGAEPNFSFALGGGDIVISKNGLLNLGITALVITVIFLLLRYSKWGLGVRATASNEFTAELMGINTHMITAVSWSIAGALGVLAAAMYASSSAISPSFMTTIQVNAFLAAILGGFSTFYGPIIGAVLIPLAASLIGSLNSVLVSSGGSSSFDFARWSMIIVYALMLVAILIKPQGLFGKRIAKKV